MSQPSRQECAGTPTRKERGAARLLVVAGAYLALASAHCTFPDYDTDPTLPGGGTASGATGNANSGASGGTPGTAGTTGAEAGALPDVAGMAAVGGSPECAPEQWPVDHCEGGCLRRFPDHCYDGVQSTDELDVDCGGECQRCTNEACSHANDCLSGGCVANAAGESNCQAALTISYSAHELNSSVGSTAWSLTLENAEPDGGQAFKMNAIKVRYYFERSGIVEPLLVRATQSNLQLADGQSRELKDTSWTVARVEDEPDGVYDAFVEVAFSDADPLYPGDHIEIYQQLLTGDPATSSFDQRAAYSFSKDSDAASLHITVLYQDKLVWGLEPRPANPRTCFARAVNLNGPDLVVAGHDFQSAAAAAVTTSGAGVSQGGTPFPAVSGSLATLFQTATRLQASDTLELPVDNGTYLVYLYGLSPTNDAAPSVFTLQGSEPELGSKFRSQASDGGQAWARLGPFRTDITSGKLTLGVSSGAITFSAIELWYPD